MSALPARHPGYTPRKTAYSKLLFPRLHVAQRVCKFLGRRLAAFRPRQRHALSVAPDLQVRWINIPNLKFRCYTLRLGRLFHIALPKIARSAEGLQIFKHRLAAFRPRLDMIDV
jgi:hypothetical protein